MAKLTDREKSILDGREGPLKRVALQFIVNYAKVLGAERLCDVTKAHLFAGAHHYMDACASDDIDEVISEMLLCSPERVSLDCFACYAQADVGPTDPARWQELGVSPERHVKNRKILEKYTKAGLYPMATCTPYLSGFLPRMGEHYVSTESHAVTLMNSLWGACANADGIEAAYCSAVCGKTPLWGNHIMSNRRGTHHFRVEFTPQDVMEWDLLGYVVGSRTPTHSIPVLSGDLGTPGVVELKSCFASMATTGGAELCHIVGVTPEAPDFDRAFGSRKAAVEDAITFGDIEKAADLFAGSGEAVDYVSLGCPHYSIDQVRDVAALLEGREVHGDTALWIWTSPAVRELADRAGYSRTIELSGARLVTSSCPLVSETWPRDASALVFDSLKQAHYIRPETKSTVLFGSMAQCVDAAVAGRWERRSSR
ncbi:MAG: aconitase X catalytic domain-containing protein [Thermovirgaceae bacterium]